jgi:signal transduction histidine kinase
MGASVRKRDHPDLSRIQSALRELAADRLEHRIEPDSGAPLSPVEQDLNQMAERLQQRREEVVRAVELYCLHRFGSVLVHDLKNLAARLHFVPENLRAAPDDLEVVETCAATVADTVERLQHLVVRFRDQREAMVLKQQSDVNRVVRSAVEQATTAVAGIRTDVQLEELPTIQMDPPYLEEAFVNILRNAVEAMAGQGTVTVRSRCGDGPNGVASVVVTFQDEGPGMTREFIDRELFAPFRSTKDRGLGLGMFSCRETVELHGGRIQVESTPGEGATFQVFLPIQMHEERLG